MDAGRGHRPRSARSPGRRPAPGADMPPGADRARPPARSRRPPGGAASGRRARGRPRRPGRPGSSSAAATISSRAPASVRKFWLSALRGRRRSVASSRRSCPGVGGTRRSGASGPVMPSSHDSERLGIASSAGPARSPAANRKPAAAPIMAPLSVHQAGGGTSSGSPIASSRSRSTAAQRAVGGDAAAERHCGHAVLVRRCHGLRRQGVDHRLLERRREAIDRDRGPAFAIAGDLAQHGGLQAGEAEVVRPRRPRPRESGWRASAPSSGRADRRAAGIRQAEQPPDLVERLAGRIVDGLPQQSIASVIGHQHQLGMAAADRPGRAAGKGGSAGSGSPGGRSRSASWRRCGPRCG